MTTSFKAYPASTVLIDVGAASATILVKNTKASIQIRVMNNGTATVWVDFFDATGGTASLTASMPFGPGVTEVLSFQAGTGTIYASAIAAGATGKVYFTPGTGI